MTAEQDTLGKEIKGLRDGLQVLVPNSPVYLAQLKEMMQKESELKALTELNPQILTMRTHQWMEKLYPEVVRITKEIAAQKGLVLALKVEEPVFPMQNPQQLMAAIQAHKVLYSGGCVDLTAEVIVELDKTNSLFEN